jgi:hypothetical protein
MAPTGRRLSVPMVVLAVSMLGFAAYVPVAIAERHWHSVIICGGFTLSFGLMLLGQARTRRQQCAEQTRGEEQQL